MNWIIRNRYKMALMLIGFVVCLLHPLLFKNVGKWVVVHEPRWFFKKFGDWIIAKPGMDKFIERLEREIG